MVLKFLENLPECSENLWKSLEVFGNFQKTSEMVQKCFSDVFIIFKVFRKSSEIFGSVQKFSENFRKVFFRCFYYFFKTSRKSSEIFRSARKSLEIFQTGSELFVMVHRS